MNSTINTGVSRMNDLRETPVLIVEFIFGSPQLRLGIGMRQRNDRRMSTICGPDKYSLQSIVALAVTTFFGGKH